MRTQKIIILTLVGLSLGFNVHAARLVPNNSPLQPIPEDTAPNISNNINSEDSEINQNLESQLPIVDITEPVEEVPGSDNQTPILPDVTEPATTNYWILLFVGLAGLMVLLIWSYLRFVRKSN